MKQRGVLLFSYTLFFVYFINAAEQSTSKNIESDRLKLQLVDAYAEIHRLRFESGQLEKRRLQEKTESEEQLKIVVDSFERERRKYLPYVRQEKDTQKRVKVASSGASQFLLDVRPSSPVLGESSGALAEGFTPVVAPIPRRLSPVPPIRSITVSGVAEDNDEEFQALALQDKVGQLSGQVATLSQQNKTLHAEMTAIKELASFGAAACGSVGTGEHQKEGGTAKVGEKRKGIA